MASWLRLSRWSIQKGGKAKVHLYTTKVIITVHRKRMDILNLFVL